MSPVPATVRLAGKEVGQLTYDRGSSRFEYHDDLLSGAHRVLGQVFEDDPQTVRTARTGLPAWFANLLPEGELRRQVVREMGGGLVSDFRLLLRLGTDLPGAVTVHADAEPDDSDDPTAADLGQAVDHPLRYSLAGVQLKYSIHSSRLTIPASGEDSWWIVKLPDRMLPGLAENEYFTMRWLRAAGMDVPRVELVPAGSVDALPDELVDDESLVYLIERYDRAPDGRVHVEDFAQLADAHPSQKYGEFGASYDTMGAVVRRLAGEAGFDAYLARLAAAVVTGNIDAHLKNWAVRYPDGRTPTLSPVYDFHSLTVYRRFQYAPLALSLAGERMPNLVGREQMRRLAEACGADQQRSEEVVESTIARMSDAWSDGLAAEVHEGLPGLAAHYAARLRDLPIVRPVGR